MGRSSVFVRIASALAALAGALGAAAVSLARDETPVLPGQPVHGTLAPDESATLPIQGTQGMALTVQIVAWRGETIAPQVELTDPAGGVVDLGDRLRVTAAGRRVKIRGLPLAQSGVYHLRISAGTGTSGSFDVRTSATRPLAVSARGTFATPGAAGSVEFHALPGDRATLSVVPRDAVVRRLVEPDDSALLIGTAGRAGPLGITELGRHRFEFDGPAGPYRARLRVLPVKPPKEWVDLAELGATGSISGRVIVEGAGQAGPGKAARGGHRGRTATPVRPGEIVLAAPGARTPAEVVAAATSAVPGVRFELVRSMTDEGPHLVRAVGTISGRAGLRDEARTRSLAKAAKASGRVGWAEPNGIHFAAREPNDASWSQQDDFRTMRLADAWETTTGAASVVVAVLDTGIWKTHPDFEGRLLGGYDFVDDAANAADGSGWDADPNDAAHDFHGTHVAGTIGAATNNRVGVAGVTWGCRILPVRVLGARGGTEFDIAAGVRWAAGLSVNGAPANANPARVLNMSLGGGFSSVEGNAVAAAIQAGAVVVAAAGNSATSVKSYPAGFAGVVSVSAAAPDLRLATYSNFGDWISVAAPGGDQSAGMRGILSTYVDASTLRPTYAELQGTSMACPHVAGVAALMLSVAPSLTPAQVKSLLETTAVDLGAPGFDTSFGHGLVDADAAVRAAKGTTAPSPVLSVMPSVLELGPGVDTGRIYVRNNGTGTITLSNVAAASDGAGGWLAATASGTDAPLTVNVTADRTGFADGLHTGSVTISTSAGTAVVPVRVIQAPPLDLGTITVAAVDADGDVRASVDTDFANDYAYKLPELPQGDYRVVAFADRDGDGEISRVDEWFGAWPVTSAPEPVALRRGSLDVTGHEFSIGRFDARFEFDGAGGGTIRGALAVRVTDGRSGAPVPGAKTYVGDGGLQAVTDARGRAVITGSLQGAQTLTVAAPGYATSSQVGADAQYQSFALEPLSAPPTFRAAVTVTGLQFDDDFIIVQVGDSYAYEVYDGFSGSVSVNLTVENETGEIPVWALVYDFDLNPVRVAIGSVEGVADGGSVNVSVDAFSPNDTFWELSNVRVSLPASNFQASSAALYADTGLFWDSSRTLVLGSDQLAPGSASRIAWVSFGDLDATLAAQIQLYAIDGLGRSSTHLSSGTVDTVTIPATLTLKSPPALTSPAAAATHALNGLSFGFNGPNAAALHVLTLNDDTTGDTAWSFWLPGGATTLSVPRVPTGGLVAGRTYTWEVSSYFIPGFDLDSYLDGALLTDVTDVTTSEPRLLTVQ